jgi:hypothetical protein
MHFSFLWALLLLVLLLLLRQQHVWPAGLEGCSDALLG